MAYPVFGYGGYESYGGYGGYESYGRSQKQWIARFGQNVIGHSSGTRLMESVSGAGVRWVMAGTLTMLCHGR